MGKTEFWRGSPLRRSQGTASLASSSENEDGEKPNPPRKRLCRTSDFCDRAIMQTNGVDYPSVTNPAVTAMDGVEDGLPNGVSNGVLVDRSTTSEARGMSKTQQEIIRLIGQFLRNLGLK